MRLSGAHCLVAVLIALALTTPCIAPAAETPIGQRFTAVPPSPPAARPLSPMATALPAGARAQFPAYDGDGFFVTLPPRATATVSADSVRDDVIAPILRAFGLSMNVSTLLMPPATGVLMPLASVRGLAHAALADYEKSPGLFRPYTRRVLDAATGVTPPDEALDGVVFAHEGRTFTELSRHIERQEIQYAFAQAIDGVPIEYTAVVGSRWDGQTISTVFGTVSDCYASLGCYVITNAPIIDRATAINEAVRILATTMGGQLSALRAFLDAGFLVLVPDGVDASGRRLLTYAYRTVVQLRIGDNDVTFMLWADAERRRPVKVERLLQSFNDGTGSVMATGLAFRRDPGAGSMPVRFRVDAARNGWYTLELRDFASRLHVVMDPPTDAADVSIDAGQFGSSGTLANFAQAPIWDVYRAPCATGPRGGNIAFLQVNLFATVYRQVAAFVAAGMFAGFPEVPLQPKLQHQDRRVQCRLDADVPGVSRLCRPGVPRRLRRWWSADARDRIVRGRQHDHRSRARAPGHARPDPRASS